jgi:hypothetical protein
MAQIGIAFGMIERKALPHAVIELHYRGKEEKCQDENSLPIDSPDHYEAPGCLAGQL